MGSPRWLALCFSSSFFLFTGTVMFTTPTYYVLGILWLCAGIGLGYLAYKEDLR